MKVLDLNDACERGMLYVGQQVVLDGVKGTIHHISERAVHLKRADGKTGNGRDGCARRARNCNYGVGIPDSEIFAIGDTVRVLSGKCEYIILDIDYKEACLESKNSGSRFARLITDLRLVSKGAQSNQMSVAEACKKGLLAVGTRVKTNASGNGLIASPCNSFVGKVTCVIPTEFAIKRDDGMSGGNIDTTWVVLSSNTMAFIEILSEEPTPKGVSVVEAYEKGLLVKGSRVKTNASDKSALSYTYTGEFVYFEGDHFYIRRDDGEHSYMGIDGEWGVSVKNTLATIEILDVPEADHPPQIFEKGDEVRVIKHGDYTRGDGISLGDVLRVTHRCRCIGKEDRIGVRHTHTHEVSCFELISKATKPIKEKEESDIMEATSTNVNDTVRTVCEDKEKSIKEMMLVNKHFGREIGGTTQDEFNLERDIDKFIERAQKKQDELDKDKK